MAEVTLYLPAHLREGHEAGQVNILSCILAALPGWRVIHAPEEAGETQAHQGFAITHMQEQKLPEHFIEAMRKAEARAKELAQEFGR